MNIRSCKEIPTGAGSKITEQKINEKLILAPGNQYYLLGILEGFCFVSGCQLKSLPLNNAEVLLKALKKEIPSVVFIDMTQATQILDAPEWKTIKLLLQENNIAFCGAGDFLPRIVRKEIESSFYKIFIEPINIEELINFVSIRMGAAYDRRSGERRKGTERRKQVVSYKEITGSNFVVASLNGSNQVKSARIHRVGPLSINYDGKSITMHGEPFEVSPREFRLIDLLSQNPGKVVSAEEIMRKIWPETNRATKADVHQYIYMLRHKLEKDPHNPQLLITVKGFGYKLCP